MRHQAFEVRSGRPRARRGRRGILPVLAALAAAGGMAAGAQVSPNGGELQVNSYTTGLQNRPAVAVAAGGGFVVAWDSLGSAGTDSSSYSVQARRFSASGQPLGNDFQVNTLTTDYQVLPAVAFGGQGDFVVVWQSFASNGNDNSGQSIPARRYDAQGIPQGAELQVNAVTTLQQTKPAIAYDGQGGFVVVWESDSSAANDPGLSIQLRRLDATGAPAGSQLQANSFTTGNQFSPAVAANAQGDFVVVWQSNGSAGTDTDSYSIHAQRYDANANPLGAELQVNTLTTAGQQRPVVALDPQGGFLVAWQSAVSGGTDTSGDSIQARRYDANGIPFGGDFQVNTYTLNQQTYPAVAADAAGNFVVAWRSMGSVGPDAVTYSIQARRFDANGSPLTGQFQVNTYSTGAQQWPTVAPDGRGNFVLAWQSAGSSGTDHSGYSIQAQRYDGLFRDGFETGNTSRWSATTP